MRKVICAMNTSIDGCYDHTRVSGSIEILDFFTEVMRGVDLAITGRKMHELMTPYWNDIAREQSGTPAENAFADAFTAIPSIVFSRTMEQTEGGPRIMRDNLEAEVRKLKQQPGKNISIGGMSLRSQLMKIGLIDEFTLIIHPVISGTGPRLFNDIELEETIKMDLVDTKIFKNGCIALRYLKS